MSMGRIKMKCPECVKSGKKSTITSNGTSMTTDVYYSPFYDEDGKYHHHDGNAITTGMECSNGHEWKHVRSGSCWCGWGKEDE